MKKGLFIGILFLMGAIAYNILGEERPSEIPQLEAQMTAAAVNQYIQGDKKPLSRIIDYLKKAAEDNDGTREESPTLLLLATALFNARNHKETLKVVQTALGEEKDIDLRAKFLFLGIPAAYQLEADNKTNKKVAEKFLGETVNLMREYCEIASHVSQGYAKYFSLQCGIIFRDLEERKLLEKKEIKECEGYF